MDVYTTIYNNGEGTLEYTFPEFVALDLLNDPSIEHNQTGSPAGSRSEVTKGDESAAGTGYPIVLGAGGPDDLADMSGSTAMKAAARPFNWIDITGTGTTITGLGDDNVVGPFPIAFDFPFYGESKTQFWVNSNGAITFTSSIYRTDELRNPNQ